MVIIDVVQAKTDLPTLIARAEAGEDVAISRNGVPVVRLVRVEPSSAPGARFLAAHGVLRGSITISDDFELTDAELDEMFDAPA